MLICYHSSQIFTKMDVRWGYNNILIKKGDEWKTAFSTLLGLFKPLVIFFRMSGSPPTFQSFIDAMFANMIVKGWLVIYMDNLLIYSDNLDKHEERVQWVLQWIKENDLHLKPSKCFFNQKEVEYLRIILCSGQVVMDPAKLLAIATWKPPQSVKVVCSFLGFCNFYWKFILNFSKLEKPLQITLPRRKQSSLGIQIATRHSWSLKSSF